MVDGCNAVRSRGGFGFGTIEIADSHQFHIVHLPPGVEVVRGEEAAADHTCSKAPGHVRNLLPFVVCKT